MLGLLHRELPKHRSCLLDQGLHTASQGGMLVDSSFNLKCKGARLCIEDKRNPEDSDSTRGRCRMSWLLSYTRKGHIPKKHLLHQPTSEPKKGVH